MAKIQTARAGAGPPKKTSLVRRVLAVSALFLSVSVGLGGFFGFLALRSSAIDQAKDTLGLFASERAARESASMTLTARNQESFKADLAARLETADMAWVRAEFSRRLRRSPDGSMRNKAESYDGAKEAGIYIAASVAIDDETMRLVAVSAALCESYGKAWLNAYPDTFVFRSDGVMVLYWPDFPAWCLSLTRSYDFAAQEYVQAGLASAEAGGSPRWTGLYSDPVSSLLMYSCLSALPGKDGKPRAVVGNDLPMESLLERMSLDRVMDSTAMVFDSGGRLIAHSGLMDRIFASHGRLALGDSGDAWILALLSDKGRELADKPAFLDPGGSALVSLRTIRGPGWSYLISVPLSSLYGPALKVSALLLLLCFVSIILSCLSLFAVIRFQIERPLAGLVAAVDAVAGGDLDARIPPAAGKELGSLADSVERMRRALKDDIEKFQAFFDLSPICLTVTRFSDGRVIMVNEAFAAMLGETPESLIGKKAVDFGYYRPGEREALVESLERDGFVKNHALKMKDLSGEERYYLMSSRRLRLSGDDCILTVILDINPLKRAEEALRESEERFRSYLEKIDDGISIVDGTGQIVFWNDAAGDITGIGRSEALGMKWWDVVYRILPASRRTPEHLEEVKAMIQGVLGSDVDFPRLVRDIQLERADGKIRFVEQRVTSVSAGGNRMFFTDVRDVTERKALEEQLRQSQKMESVGRLAGGVAHDFNNLLTAIIGNIDLATSLPGLDQTAKAYLETAMRASESAATLTRQLLAFSRKQAIAPTTVDIGALLNGMRSMLARLLGENIALGIKLREGLWPARIDPGQLDQVILNLAVNAKDAMPNGGNLSFEGENVVLDKEYCRFHPDAKPGEYARISISDTGTGMSPEAKSHLFEPFFTTKGLGRGTGLGLATVYGAVVQNEGRIEVYSEEGMGTTFRIYFPRAVRDQAEQAATAAAPEAKDLDAPEGITIFLAEDEELLRTLATDSLAGRGYRVLAFPDGASALKAAESERIDILVTDVIMPGMNGRELADALSALHPEMRVIYTSGYTDDIIAKHGILEQGIDFLPKPYNPKDLLRRVKAALRRPD